MLTIYGSDLSSPANKVRFVANYLGLAYEYRVMNLREGEQRQEWFLKINPIGKVPAIKDGDFCLFESGAIIKYLCEKAGSDLLPKALSERAVVEQWNEFVTHHIMVNVSRLVFNRVFATRMGFPVSQESIADGEKFLSQNLPHIERQLTQHSYVAGNKISLADISLLAALDPSEVAGIDLSKYPKLVAWRNQMKQQPFYTKCFKTYGESLMAQAAK